MATKKRGVSQPVTVIANRLPVSSTGDRWRVSAGGLVTALKPVMEKHDGAWVGWDGGANDVPRRVDGLDIDLAPVSLTRNEVQSYYHGFSNRTIWPLFHDLVQPAVFDRAWWRSYKEVNQKFADAAAADIPKERRRRVMWVQDYHLMLVPQLLREREVRCAITYFLHIPFPPPELFSRLPWREEVLRGLLGADVVSFHTDRYRKNFVRTCGRLLNDVKVRGNRLIHPDGREVQTNAAPISIDADEFAETAQTDAVRLELERVQRQFEGRRILLGVDRLDYTKGIHERLLAFESLLEDRPDLRGRIALVQIAVPSRGSVREYRELREDIEQLVGHINGRFTEPGHDVPLHYIHRGVPRERLLAYYQLADVMLVTPLKDGMNLVAKEFVVTQQAVRGSGALVLSEFTGAALELERAVLCNPFDVEGLSLQIARALELDEKYRRDAIALMARKIHNADVHRWVERQLAPVLEEYPHNERRKGNK